ncbi:MAG TPA: hypothetical protein VKY66_01320 [Protaetiibacter sp.]|nr:hypothetical protein [Protaetiibacter sp.]
MHVAQFERPIAMKINVAKRLQNQDRGDRGIPSEDYYVAWDGVELLVMWEATGDKNEAGYFGGFAAIDVLAEGLKAANLRLRVEPCGPSCSYPFAHRDLLISSNAGASDVRVTDRTSLSVDVTTPPESNPLRLVRELNSRFGFNARSFARMRSFGASVVSSDREARWDMSQLLRIQYEMAQDRSLPFFKSIRNRWKRRFRPKQMAKIAAGLWLRLATIEDNRRKWFQARKEFESSGRYGEDLIFAIEYPEEVRLVETTEVDDLRSAVGAVSQRADSRTITMATVVGAVTGGVAGGLIALIAAFASASVGSAA